MSKNGGTLLHDHAEAGQVMQLEAELNRDLTKIDNKNIYGDTPLLWACAANQYDACVVLLQSGALIVSYLLNYLLTNSLTFLHSQVQIFTRRISLLVHQHCIKHARRVILNCVNCLYHVDRMW